VASEHCLSALVIVKMIFLPLSYEVITVYAVYKNMYFVTVF